MENNTVQEERLMTRLQKFHKKNVPSITPSIIAPPERTSRQGKAPKRTGHRKSHIAKGWVLTVLFAIIITLALNVFVFGIVMVDGDSMTPTLDSNQRVVVDKVSRYFSLPGRGQIVVVNYPNMPGNYVKRLIGLPGDIIEIKNNVVYINGSPIQENYIPAGQTIANVAQTAIPVGTIFVIGDNRSVSLDSRSPQIGPISIDNLLGNALLVIWPPDQIHPLT